MKSDSSFEIITPKEIALPEPLNFDEFTQLESISYFKSIKKIKIQKHFRWKEKLTEDADWLISFACSVLTFLSRLSSSIMVTLFAMLWVDEFIT